MEIRLLVDRAAYSIHGYSVRTFVLILNLVVEITFSQDRNEGTGEPRGLLKSHDFTGRHILEHPILAHFPYFDKKMKVS
jgi:hypothetical protein